jgi:hypothetical protein
MGTVDSGDNRHVNELELAGYLDGGLIPSERDRIEAHLADCATCRRDVLESRVLLRRVRLRRRVMVGGAAAAAAIILLAMPLMRGEPLLDRTDVTRADPAPSALVSYGPTGETRIGAVRFIWGGVRDAVTYRLSVTRSDGTSIFTLSGADTAVALPPSIALIPGERYFWTADALLSDGTTRTTGLREFAAVR